MDPVESDWQPKGAKLSDTLDLFKRRGLLRADDRSLLRIRICRTFHLYGPADRRPHGTGVPILRYPGESAQNTIGALVPK